MARLYEIILIFFKSPLFTSPLHKQFFFCYFLFSAAFAVSVAGCSFLYPPTSLLPRNTHTHSLTHTHIHTHTHWCPFNAISLICKLEAVGQTHNHVTQKTVSNLLCVIKCSGIRRRVYHFLEGFMQRVYTFTALTLC